jgi:hypothetical protein
MPTGVHEAPIALVKARPAILTHLLDAVHGVQVPAFTSARPYATDAKKLVPATYHSDALVVFYNVDTAVQSVLFEVQLEWDPDKRWTLPLYVSHAEIDTKTNCLLVIFCPNRTVAGQYKNLFPVSALSSMHLSVLVLSPDDVDLVLDPDDALADPDRAVFAALCHGADLDRDVVFPVLGKLLDSLDPLRATMYVNMLLAGLPRTLAPQLEDYLMTTAPILGARVYLEGKAEGRAEGKAEGIVAGRAADVLEILELRAIRVTARSRAKILACADPDQLSTWLRDAVTADTITDVLRPRAQAHDSRRSKNAE